MQQLHSMNMSPDAYVKEMEYWQSELQDLSWQEAALTIQEAQKDCMGWMNASFLISKFGSVEAIPEEELTFPRSKYADYDQKLHIIAMGEMPEIDERIKVLAIWQQMMEYGLSYENVVWDILKSANDIRMLTEFSNQQMFVYRNAEKTERDFKQIVDIPLEIIQADIIPSVVNYESNLFFLLAYILLTILFLLQPIENGIESLLHTTKLGEIDLAVQRVSLLAAAAIGFTFLSSIELLFLGKVLYQQPFYFLVPAQNLSIFASWTGRNSVFFVFLWIEFLQSIGIFLAGMLIWLFLSQLRQQTVGLMVLIGFLGLEYSFYQRYGIHDAGYVLALINLFQLLFPNRWAQRYYNYDIAGYPWNEKVLLSVALVVLSVIVMSLCFLFHSRIREKHSKGYVNDLYLRLKDKIIQRMPIHWMPLYEFKKWMITSRGSLFVIVGILVLTMQIPSRIELSTPEIYYYQYLELYHGELDNSYREDMEWRLEQIKEEITLSLDPYSFTSLGTADLREQEEGLKMMIDRYDFLNLMNREIGNGIELVDDRPYQRVWGEEGHDYRLKCSVILMAMFVLLIPHLFGLEERGKMKEMLFVSSKGRHEIWSVKLMLTVMLSLLSGVLLIIMEIFQYLQCGGNIHDFTLSTQCFLVEYDPLSQTTLFLFLSERFILIFLHMMTNGILVFAISSIWSGYLTGVSISAGVLFAPMLIETLGLSGKTAISAPANLTLSVSWLKDGQAFIIWMLIELALIIAGILTSRAGWKKKMRISFD